MAETPTKSVGQRLVCILCRDKESWRYLKFSDTKCKDNQTLSKIEELLNEDVTTLCLDLDAGICQPCFNKVEKLYSFRHTAKQCLREYKNSLKRGSKTPG